MKPTKNRVLVQKIEKEDSKGAVVAYYLVINYEFVHQIVANGEHVKVLEPDSLAKEVKKVHQQALK